MSWQSITAHQVVLIGKRLDSGLVFPALNLHADNLSVEVNQAVQILCIREKLGQGLEQSQPGIVIGHFGDRAAAVEITHEEDDEPSDPLFDPFSFLILFLSFFYLLILCRLVFGLGTLDDPDRAQLAEYLNKCLEARAGRFLSDKGLAELRAFDH